LKGEQSVDFGASDKNQSIKRIKRSKRTKLTAFLNSIVTWNTVRNGNYSIVKFPSTTHGTSLPKNGRRENART